MTAPHIRPETPDDEAQIAAVVAAAFESEREARLVADIRGSDEFIPELALVAEVDGQVVGHVMISYSSLVDGEAAQRVAQLSPLAVAPQHQRQGIGSALVREVAARARDRAEPLVVLQGSPAFYGRLGFEPAGPLGVEMALPAWAPPEAAQVMRFEGYDPSMRGRVVDPPAFAEIVAAEAARTDPPS